MRELLKAIKEDNLILFKKLIEEPQIKDSSFGRFPVLSVLYLYNAKKILKEFESELLKISEYYIKEEPMEIFFKFKTYAKREIRIYTMSKNIVSPIEMLYILEDMEGVERLLPFYNKEEILSNLKKIEKIKSQKDLEVTKKSIKIIKPRLSKHKKIITSIAAIVFIAFICISVFATIFSMKIGLGTKKQPFIVKDSQVLASAFEKNLESIALSKNIEVKEQLPAVKGMFDGKGCSIVVNNLSTPLFKEVTGTIKNVNIIINNKKDSLSENYIGVVEENNGVFENVNIQYNLDLKIEADIENLVITPFIKLNNGELNNININGQVKIVGKEASNTYFAPLCFQNNNVIESAKSTINADVIDCDIAGMALYNLEKAKINNSILQGKILHTASSNNWNPYLGGIVMENSGYVENCSVNAMLNVKNTTSTESDITPEAFMGGIAAINKGIIHKCKVEGELTIDAGRIVGAVGGLTGYNAQYVGWIENCLSLVNFIINTYEKDSYVYVGGISGYDQIYAIVNNFSCINVETNIAVELDKGAIKVGAISGQILTQPFMQYYLQNNNFVERENVKYGVGTIESQNISGITKHDTYESMKKVDGYWE